MLQQCLIDATDSRYEQSHSAIPAAAITTGNEDCVATTGGLIVIPEAVPSNVGCTRFLSVSVEPGTEPVEWSLTP